MCRLNMPKKDAKTETKDGPKKSMSEFVPTKEMKVMQKEDTEKMEETAFPTRQNNVLHDGTIGMAVWCLFVLAGITHLFQTGSSFMMNTNAKFGHSLVAQFFCVQMALTIVYILLVNLHIRLDVSNAIYLGLVIAFEVWSIQNHAPAFHPQGAWVFIGLHGLMLLLSLGQCFKTVSFLNTAAFFTFLYMFFNADSFPLLAVTYNNFTRAFLGFHFCGLWFMTMVNVMPTNVNVANFMVSVFWLGIDLMVVEDHKFWKGHGWKSSLLLLGIHGGMAAYHQLNMLMTAGAKATATNKKMFERAVEFEKMKSKAMKDQGIEVPALAAPQEEKRKDL